MRARELRGAWKCPPPKARSPRAYLYPATPAAYRRGRRGMVLPGLPVGLLGRERLRAFFRGAQVVQLGILDVVDEGAGELAHGRVVEVVALVFQVVRVPPGYAGSVRR